MLRPPACVHPRCTALSRPVNALYPPNKWNQACKKRTEPCRRQQALQVAATAAFITTAQPAPQQQQAPLAPGPIPAPALAPPAVPHKAARRLFGDALMEASRPELRSVFEIEDWPVLRNTNRYIRHVLSLHQSRVLLGMVKPLAYVLAMSAAACAYGAAHQAGMLPALAPALGTQLRQLYNITSSSLSLLLVFRTNSSYARWEEAVKMWGQVVVRTRDLVRMSLTWVGEEKKELRALLCRWAPAFSKALLCHLRAGEDLRAELQGLLLPHEVAAVLRAHNRPAYVLQVLSAGVRAAHLPSRITLRMQDCLTALEDCLGACERLLTTPVSQLYTGHTSRCLVAWLALLPWALWSSCRALTLPLTLLIAFLLLGIDKIGVSIEEPFSILPLEHFAATAVADVSEMVAMHDPTNSAVAAAGSTVLASSTGGSSSGSNGSGSSSSSISSSGTSTSTSGSQFSSSFASRSDGSGGRFSSSFSSGGSSVWQNNVVPAAGIFRPSFHVDPTFAHSQVSSPVHSMHSALVMQQSMHSVLVAQHVLGSLHATPHSAHSVEGVQNVLGSMHATPHSAHSSHVVEGVQNVLRTMQSVRSMHHALHGDGACSCSSHSGPRHWWVPGSAKHMVRLSVVGVPHGSTLVASKETPGGTA